MSPNDVDRDQLFSREPQPESSPVESFDSGVMQLPRLGYKRCTACRKRRAIRGGSQKAGLFVCAACRSLAPP